METIRILIADDSVVNREMLRKCLSTVSDFEIVGTARDGRQALERVERLQPDLVILDVEMPEMDGLETLRHLRAQYPRLPVIMFSTLTERGAAITVHALSLGANDYVTKPTLSGGPPGDALQAQILEAFIPRIRGLCRKPPAQPAAQAPLQPAAPAPAPARPARRSQRIQMVGIGISTGGPSALLKLFAEFPPDFPVPILIVQHMLPMFTRSLAERLDSQSALTIVEAQDKQSPRSGTAYIAPGNYHLLLEPHEGQLRLRTNQEPPQNSCRPSVDVLFESLARVCGPAVLGVIMTGMGNDGLRGSELIARAGGQILAQDEASSTIWGMPGYVAKAGLADQVLPLNRLAAEITRLARS